MKPGMRRRRWPTAFRSSASPSRTRRRTCSVATIGRSTTPDSNAWRRQHLARRFEPLRIADEIARHRDAAELLVRTAWAEQRIRLVAAALLRHGTLTGDEISAL